MRKKGRERGGHARQMVIGRLQGASERECVYVCMRKLSMSDPISTLFRSVLLRHHQLCSVPLMWPDSPAFGSICLFLCYMPCLHFPLHPFPLPTNQWQRAICSHLVTHSVLLFSALIRTPLLTNSHTYAMPFFVFYFLNSIPHSALFFLFFSFSPLFSLPYSHPYSSFVPLPSITDTSHHNTYTYNQSCHHQGF